MAHLGALVLMLALGAIFVPLGAMPLLDRAARPPAHGRRPPGRSRAWWVAALATGAGLLTGLGVADAALLGGAVAAAVLIVGSPA